MINPEDNNPNITAQTPCPLELNMGEVQLITTQLAELPHKQVGMTMRRIEAQVLLAMHKAQQPPAAPLPTLEDLRAQILADIQAEQLRKTGQPEGALMLKAESALAARDHLERASHESRRTGDGTLVVPPAEHPDDDYAQACILISGAEQQLDESLPNNQLDRTLHAYAALEYGVRALGDYLRRRKG